MHSRFAQLTFLVFVGLLLAFLIPALGPAVRELASRPSFVAAPQTTSLQTSATPQTNAVPKLNLQDPRVRNETEAKITSNVNRIKQLSREFKAVWDRKPPKIEGDVVDVSAFEKDLPKGKVKEYKEKATEVKTLLASLVLQSYESQGLELFKELYRSSDAEFGAAILSAVQMVSWDESQKPGSYRELRQLLRTLADNSRDPNQKEALHQLLALHPVDAETLNYISAKWNTFTEGEKRMVLPGVLAFSDAGFAFLKDKILNDPVSAIREQALAQLVRHDVRGNSKEVREKIAAFLKANNLQQRAKKYYIPEESLSSGSGVRTQSKVQNAYLAQVNLPSGCTPFKNRLSFDEGLQGSAVSLDVVNERNLSRGLSTDNFSAPGGFPVYVRAVRRFNNRTGSDPLTFDVSLVNTSQNLGTAGNAPADGAVKQDDMLLMIAPEEAAHCTLSYTGGSGPRTPQPAPRWRPRRKEPEPPPPPPAPICGNGFVEPPEACDPPGTPCSAPGVHIGVCTNACQCVDVSAPGKPLSSPPPAGGSDAEPSVPSVPNGGLLRSPATNFLAQVNPSETPVDPRQALFDNPQPRSAGHTALELVWPGTPAGSGPSPESTWTEALACDAKVATLDARGRTKVRFEVSPQGWSGELEVPPDADGDLVPDIVEAQEQLFNPATGRLEATDMCNPNTRGVPEGDAGLDPDIDFWRWNRLTSGAQGPMWARNGQEKNGDGLTRWEEMSGLVLPESPIEQLPDGRAARLALRVNEMRTERYGQGEENQFAIPAVKQLFMKDDTLYGVIQFLRGREVSSTVTKLTGIQPVNIGDDYDEWAKRQTVLFPGRVPERSIEIGDLMGAVNPYNARDAAALALGAQPGVRFREYTAAELREFISLGVTLCRENCTVKDYLPPDPETPPGTVLSLPMLFAGPEILDRFFEITGRGFPGVQNDYFQKVGLHETTHKLANARDHPSFPVYIWPLPGVISFADVPGFLLSLEFRPGWAYFIERRIGENRFDYYVGTDIKLEASPREQLAPYYEVPSGVGIHPLERIELRMRPGLPPAPVSDSGYFIRLGDQGRSNVRVKAFGIEKFVSSNRPLSFNELLLDYVSEGRVLSSRVEIPPPEPVGYGGDVIEEIGGSLLNLLSVGTRESDYRRMDPASSYRRP